MGDADDDAPEEHAAVLDAIDCALRGHRFRRPNLRLCVRCGFEDPNVPPTISRGRAVRWTPQMDAKLLVMRAHGHPFDFTAREIGVSVEAVRYRVWSLSCRPEVVGLRLLHEAAADTIPDTDDFGNP